MTLKERLAQIIGVEVCDGLAALVEKMLATGQPTSVCYDSKQLGNCYWEYRSLVFGDRIMPGGNGGPARALTDVVDPVLGRVRTCYYTVDSSG